MKNFLPSLFVRCVKSISHFLSASQNLLHLTNPVTTRIEFSNDNYTTEKSRIRFLSGHFFLMALFFLISIVKSNAQITDSSTFPLNDYLYTTSDNPYPLVNTSKLNTIDTSRFVNVMNYGAKGDGGELNHPPLLDRVLTLDVSDG